MTDKNINIDKDEVFSKLIKDKLENHPMPVPDDIWAGIEQQLTEEPKKRRPALWYWLTGGVAAAIALMLLLRPLNDIPQTSPSVSSTYEKSNDVGPKPDVIVEEPASDSAVADYENNHKPTPAEPEKAAGSFPEKTNKKPLHADNHSNTNHLRIADGEVKIPSQGENSIAENVKIDSESIEINRDKSAETVAEPAKDQSTTDKIEKIDKLPDLNDYPVIPEHTKRPKKKQKMLLAAAFGTGGNTSSSKIDAPPTMMRAPGRQLVSSEVTKNYSGILNANDYSNSQHFAPISAGVTVEKPLTDRLGIESGLVYTYLKSVLNNPGNVDYNGTLELHYLGIPLNARFKALKKPKWNLYVSAGGMVEKGLRSFYQQEVENPSMSRETVVKSNIDGLQWSLNGALGADYRLNKDLSLFIEPKLIYYLENNQPKSARTEQPLTIGFNGGLRIEL